MPDKSEKERRKQIIDELRKKADEEFEKNLPMSRDDFKNLFDYLDIELGRKECDNTLKLTQEYLLNNSMPNIISILDWLRENGAGCDCEVLANIEEAFLN